MYLPSMRRYTALTLVLLLSAAGILGAQESPSAPSSAPASIVMMPAHFATLNDDAHLLRPGLGAMSETAATWWGLGRGATVGAVAALSLTQAFCADDNGCVGRTIGAVFVGSLLGGALESGMEY